MGLNAVTFSSRVILGVRVQSLPLQQGLKITVRSAGSVGSSTGKGWLVDVDAIVLDEVHYLSDNSRGTVVEETVSFLERQLLATCTLAGCVLLQTSKEHLPLQSTCFRLFCSCSTIHKSVQG